MGDEADGDTRDLCKYGADCYQKNPEHRKKYKHPKRVVEEKERPTKKNKVEASPQKNESIGVSTSDNDTIKTSKCDSPKESDDTFVELPSDVPSRIESVFLATMPDDFYSFFDFCKSMDEQHPHNALAAVDIKLVGPYDLIEKNLKMFTKEEGLRHYRYYYDPPEFLTILACSKKLLHYGYLRDNPKDIPSFLACNEASSGCSFEIVGSNVFSALIYHIEKQKKVCDPFKKMKLQKIQQAVNNWCTKNNIPHDTYAKANRERKSKMITKTFHGAGIVVPYNKKTEVGYRELQEDDKNLKKILSEISNAKSEDERQIAWTKLQPVITFASIANDEFDFGAGLELGIDLFCHGDPIFHKTILNILPTSYELLGRSEFTSVLKAHLKNRVKESDLNTIIVQ